MIYLSVSFDLNFQKPYAEELKVSIGACEPDREAWRRLCISFLKGGLWSQSYNLSIDSNGKTQKKKKFNIGYAEMNVEEGKKVLGLSAAR